MLRELLPGVWSWSHFSEEKKLNFNGLLVQGEGLWTLIDPPPATTSEVQEIQKRKIEAIFLTNGDHERACLEMKKKTGAPLWIHEKDASSLEEVKADRFFNEGDLLPGGFRVIHLEDHKTPGESALYLEERRILILGDALIGHPPGKLRLLPDDKFSDVSKAKKSLLRLLEFDFDALFVGDGDSIPQGGRDAVEQLFQSWEGVRVE